MGSNHHTIVPAEDRFWPKVQKSDGCWEWTGAKQPAGYGNFYFRGVVQLAHRVAWELANGPVAVGQHVLHRCDNPRCVRIEHLFLGTHADNMRDMLSKGRA